MYLFLINLNLNLIFKIKFNVSKTQYNFVIFILFSTRDRKTKVLPGLIWKVTDFYYATIGFNDWLWKRLIPKQPVCNLSNVWLHQLRNVPGRLSFIFVKSDCHKQKEKYFRYYILNATLSVNYRILKISYKWKTIKFPFHFSVLSSRCYLLQIGPFNVVRHAISVEKLKSIQFFLKVPTHDTHACR